MIAGKRLRWALFGTAIVASSMLVFGAFNPAPHTGGDNAGYVSLAYSLLTTGSYTEVFDPAGLPHTKYPPVFPAILAALIWLGARSWVALKGTAVVSTVLSVGFTYLWCERRLGAWPAFATAVLLGASSAVVYYSHWILSDPVFLALTVAALWTLSAAERKDSGRVAWLFSGVALAGLAYFTRSAGLPLVAATLSWLALRRRWRALALAALALGIPALAWYVRGAGAPDSYGSEFWMADPYQPALGTIGVLGLVPRAFANLSGYVTRFIPGGIVGGGGAGVAVLGVALTVSTLYGWVRCLRERVGPAELFFPLYAGLILLWPQVWSGDRFALPLFPLMYFYSAVTLKDVRRRVPVLVGNVLLAAAILVVLLPALSSWGGQVQTARACAEQVHAAGPFGCYGPGVRAFVEAAEWSGASLPEGAAVMSRKPRIFYVLSGVPSRTFPFDDDPAAQLGLADRVGAAYVLLDEWDGQAGRYVGGAVVRSPGAFCYVRAFGRPGAGGAQLLGVLPLADRKLPEGAPSEVRLAVCPATYTSEGAGGAQASSPSTSPSGEIPLLEGLDP
jgi:4-amino-4-deoxy-L-arabinose transferase-like glycosyltransferase